MDSSGVAYYREKLRTELKLRSKRNARYSLRSFANHLKIDPSSLSLILSGKRAISTKLVDRIFVALEFDEFEKRKFLESVLKEKQSLGLKRISPKLSQKLVVAPESRVNANALKLDIEVFKIISDWYHYAILELTELPKFNPDPKWIAKSLKIPEDVTHRAIERLIRQKLLVRDGNRLKRTAHDLDTSNHSKTSEFHRKRQRQILSKSLESLNNDSIDIRNHSSVTFLVNPERMVLAKKMIQDFTWELARFMMVGEAQTVYELSVSLFPLQVAMPTDSIAYGQEQGNSA